MQRKTFMFLVQGEGRGHLTQAISISEILQQKGMELCCVVVGSCSKKSPPVFFKNAIASPVISVASPGFISDAKNKSIKPGKTLLLNLCRMGTYIKSVRTINKLVNYHKPDIIVNFYEPLAAIYNIIYPGKTKMVSVAHQFIYLHPDFHFPQNNFFKKQMLRAYTRFVSMRSEKVLAISMYDLPGKMAHLQIIPPLMRGTILTLKPAEENFILVYLVNSGYQEEIINWHEKNPEVSLHCFTDCRTIRDEKNGEWKYDETLTFHSLNDVKFMQMMAGCSAVATTAGFESICEAMYLSKPVMMVPVAGQFEQFCNAVDAQKTGAGIRSENFDLSLLMRYIPLHNATLTEYKNWVRKAEEMLLHSIATI